MCCVGLDVELGAVLISGVYKYLKEAHNHN